MKEIISENKLYYLVLGLVAIVFVIFPYGRDNVSGYSIFQAHEQLSVFLFITLIYPLILVPTNFIYRNVYKDGYYNKITLIMTYVLPIVGILTLVFFRSSIDVIDDTSFQYTIFYYLAFAYIILSYGVQIFLIRKNSYML
ncbi:MAG: hypothetical protein JXL85_05980 [Bacilli bacterium]|nr:hypothetical protein [Bacilli bacterium]